MEKIKIISVHTNRWSCVSFSFLSHKKENGKLEIKHENWSSIFNENTFIVVAFKIQPHVSHRDIIGHRAQI